MRNNGGDGFSTVSQGRKRLRERLKGDKHLSQMIQRVEVGLSILKICPFLFDFCLLLIGVLVGHILLILRVS
ncbi:MAG: hypothetical protein L3J18_09200 [Candidatus Brocadia sp.]|nr:MAG: hypothetical protein L3J18_09200 [Candidatus Brocadia sp.]